MTIALAVGMLLESVLVYLAVERGLSARDASEARWAQERRELLNRIQRPDYMPVAAAAQFHEPEVEADDMELVGTIRYPDEEE